MKACKPFEAVIFDMDGVLLDSEILYFRHAARVAAQMGRCLPRSLYVDTIGRAWPDGEKIYRGYFGDDFDLEYLMQCTHEGVRRQTEQGGVPLKPGVVALLDWLTARGVPLAVATSTAAARAEGKLAQAGLRGYFSALIGGDQVARSKPDPGIYLAAAAALGIQAAACVAFEDSPAGLHAAYGAGMQAVMVPDMVPADGALSALAAAVLTSLEEAPAWLEGGCPAALGGMPL